MAIDKKRIEEFEEKHKEALFEKISEIASKNFEVISLISTNTENIGKTSIDIPRTSITLNNKLVELSQEFKKAGISMFSSELEEYDVVSSSFLGDAIIQDLIDKLLKSSEKLNEYNKKIGSVSKNKNEQVQALQKASPIRKIFSRIRSLFVRVKPVEISLTEEEQHTLDTPLKEYRDINDKMWNYNLEDNLVPAIVKAIAGPQKFGEIEMPHSYAAYNVPGLLEKNVIPDLKKLGLEHLIPQLQEALVEEYKKDLPDPSIYQVSQEDMNLYVPDFSKRSQKEQEISENDLEELHGKTKDVLAEGKRALKSTKRSLRKNGIALEDFAVIDKTVSTSNRQEMTKVIDEELHPVQENNKERAEETTDISLE